jgi:hypothetical protein
MIMVMSILICCSLALGNGLIAMRIIGLWDYNPVLWRHSLVRVTRR